MTGWDSFAAWMRFWRTWWFDPPTCSMPEEDESLDGVEARRLAREIRKEYRSHIEEQERIRDLFDKNIQRARSLEQDIQAVVTDMAKRRGEADNE